MWTRRMDMPSLSFLDCHVLIAVHRHCQSSPSTDARSRELCHLGLWISKITNQNNTSSLLGSSLGVFAIVTKADLCTDSTLCNWFYNWLIGSRTSWMLQRYQRARWWHQLIPVMRTLVFHWCTAYRSPLGIPCLFPGLGLAPGYLPCQYSPQETSCPFSPNHTPLMSCPRSFPCDFWGSRVESWGFPHPPCPFTVRSGVENS